MIIADLKAFAAIHTDVEALMSGPVRLRRLAQTRAIKHVSRTCFCKSAP